MFVVTSWCSFLFLLTGCATQPTDHPATTASLSQAINSKTDLWGEAAIAQSGGPSYSFFEKLLPPLRYVDASFREYPIVMSAPGAAVKGRLVSNGSIINARARTPDWGSEVGVPLRVYISAHRLPFGSHPNRTDGPHYERDFLPIVNLSSDADGERYGMQCFAATEPQLAAHGVMYVRFTLERGDAGRLELQIENPEPLVNKEGVLRTKAGKIVFCVGPAWKHRPINSELFVTLKKDEPAIIAIATDPVDKPIPVDAAAYDAAHRQAVTTWEQLLDGSMQVSVPEPVVNNAWRSLICGSYALLDGDVIRYSAGNAYQKLYEAEGSDAAKSLLLWGRRDDVKKMIVPLLNFTRAGLEYHQAGLKLQLLTTYYWMTRDADFVREQKEKWQKEIDRIISGREKESGLLPREKYAGDIDTRVYSLNSNANSWRGMRDMAAVLDELGEHDQVSILNEIAANFRNSILAAVEKSIYRDVKPPFIPQALFGDEKPYDVITATRPGSYYDLMIPYVLGSNVFKYDSAEQSDIIRTLRQHGGLCMGMIRTGAAGGFWVNTANLDDLYGIRYELAVFQRDDVDHALVSFYGKLAQGMTRDAFISAEGTCLTPLDQYGRQMYLPPNSAGNAHFLYLLRYLLVQDWDMDDDGKPDTLRLLYATPRAWLEDGKEIKVEHAPTAFGEISVIARSHVKQGRVAVEVSLPEHKPAHALLRLRLPEGLHVKSASGSVAVKDDVIDLTGMSGHVSLDVRVGR